MLIGLVGKPNTGKSTFFSAATLIDVEIASYPFTTIKPNVGVAYAKVKEPALEFGLEPNPRNSVSVGNYRFVPFKLMDVAGLVPGAHEGRGLGNKFLDDLRQAKAFIMVVDCSGRTDEEGRILKEGIREPWLDVEFLEQELDHWISSILLKGSKKGEKEFLRQLTGLGIKEEEMRVLLDELGMPTDIEYALEFSKRLRERYKPMVIAANKIDVEGAPELFKELKKRVSWPVVPVSAEAELALRRASKSGLIRYVPGEREFEVLKDLGEKQRKGLELIKERVLEPFGCTGVQKAINTLIFEVLEMVVVFPVENEQRLCDKSGNVLPDAFLMPKGSTALDLAEKVHSEIAKQMICAIDVRTKKRLAKDYVLKNLDILKIVFKKA